MQSCCAQSCPCRVCAHAELAAAREREREGVEERVGGLSLEGGVQGAGTK